MFKLGGARSSYDDIAHNLDDVQRVDILVEAMSALQQMASRNQPVSVDGIIRELTTLGPSSVRTLDGSLDFSIRDKDCCSHMPVHGFCAIAPKDVHGEMRGFTADFDYRLSQLAQKSNTALAEPALSREDVGDFCAWAHMEILRIRPLSYGNLLLAQCTVVAVLSELNDTPLERWFERNGERLDVDAYLKSRPQDSDRLRRIAYDESVAERHARPQGQLLVSFILTLAKSD